MSKQKKQGEFVKAFLTKAVTCGGDASICFVLCGTVQYESSEIYKFYNRCLQTKHSQHIGELEDFFLCKENTLKKQCFFS